MKVGEKCDTEQDWIDSGEDAGCNDCRKPASANQNYKRNLYNKQNQ